MAKPIIFGIFFFLVVGLFAGIRYSTEVDEVQRDLIEAKRELAQMETAVARQETVTVQRRELAALIQANDILAKRNYAIRDEIRALEQAEGQVGDAFVAAIEKVRAETVGITMDEMPLPGGRVLKRVRIQGIDESEITVVHAEGISKVAIDDLPDSLKERLRIGIKIPGRTKSAVYRSSSDASERMAALGRTDSQDEKKKATKSHGDVSIEGDPALWQSVTRQSLGRAFVPGSGWLEIGTKGPIPGTAK